MTRLFFQILTAGCLFAASTISHAAKVYYPIRGLADESTGYIQSKEGGYWWRGSGVVAKDPKLIYSCAHVFYEEGEWSTKYFFKRAHHSQYEPSTSASVAPRGFRYFTSYVNRANSKGSDSASAFAMDFTVLYGNSSFGPAVGTWADGSGALVSALEKRIVGYPAEIDYTGQNGHGYQHATPWFTIRGERSLDAYHTFDNVSTGPGNSGGPVFVWNDDDQNYYLAGILVSGGYDSAGVRALDFDSDTMANRALGVKTQLQDFTNANVLPLPDASASFSTRKIEVSGFTGSVVKLRFSMSATTTHRGDLEVFLRSPSGRIHWITKRSGGAKQDLNIVDADYSEFFKDEVANGTWQLRIRDAVAGDLATFQQCSLSVTAF